MDNFKFPFVYQESILKVVLYQDLIELGKFIILKDEKFFVFIFGVLKNFPYHKNLALEYWQEYYPSQISESNKINNYYPFDNKVLFGGQVVFENDVFILSGQSYRYGGLNDYLLKLEKKDNINKILSQFLMMLEKITNKKVKFI